MLNHGVKGHQTSVNVRQMRRSFSTPVAWGLGQFVSTVALPVTNRKTVPSCSRLVSVIVSGSVLLFSKRRPSRPQEARGITGESRSDHVMAA